MVYDSARHVVVLVGTDAISMGTYEWDGTDWTRRTQPNDPAFHPYAALAYDSVRQLAVLFGGGFTSDTWEWDGSNWTQAFPPTSPAPRQAHRMVFDPFLQRVVLFGGEDQAGTYFGDIWLWDGSNWTQATTPSGPAPRIAFGMAMDDRWPHALLFGGATGQPGFVNDTWQLWSSQPPTATFATYGTGCAGTAGTPRLQVALGSRPIIGSDFPIEIDQLPILSFAVPFGVLGFDRTAWAGLPLPTDLGFVGMPGCQAWIDAQFNVGLVNAQGHATWHLAIPPLPYILGVTFYVQGYVFDFAANPGNAVVSNAGEALIGV